MRRFQDDLAGVVDRPPMFNNERDDSDFGGCGGGEGLIDNDWAGDRINATMVTVKARVWVDGIAIVTRVFFFTLGFTLFLLYANLFLAVIRQPKTIRVNEKDIKVYIFVKTVVARLVLAELKRWYGRQRWTGAGTPVQARGLRRLFCRNPRCRL
jgi:hypothetical protein